MEPRDVQALAREHGRRLIGVKGVVGVMLGGSQAQGRARPDSDIDLGVYYRGELDVAGLEQLATVVTGRPTAVTEPGGWGPWVNGGGWLEVGGQRVDWILRDLDRVQGAWLRAVSGEFSVHYQPGHPFGFLDVTYAGEVALGQVVADPSGELRALASAANDYPPALRSALIGWLWEAGFSLDVARKAAGRGDTAYVAMCITRAIGILAHALHADARRWVVNEKGLVDAANALPGAPEGFARRAHACCALGDGLVAKLDSARTLLEDVRSAVSL